MERMLEGEEKAAWNYAGACLEGLENPVPCIFLMAKVLSDMARKP